MSHNAIINKLKTVLSKMFEIDIDGPIFDASFGDELCCLIKEENIMKKSFDVLRYNLMVDRRYIFQSINGEKSIIEEVEVEGGFTEQGEHYDKIYLKNVCNKLIGVISRGDIIYGINDLKRVVDDEIEYGINKLKNTVGNLYKIDIENSYCICNYPSMNKFFLLKIDEFTNNEEQRMEDDKTNKVIEELGDNVLTVCIEECAELIQAITKYKRYVSTSDGKVHKHYYDRDTREYYMNLHEEIADALEMIDWLIKYMEFDTKMIDTLRTLKKARAWDRLQEGELR